MNLAERTAFCLELVNNLEEKDRETVVKALASTLKEYSKLLTNSITDKGLCNAFSYFIGKEILVYYPTIQFSKSTFVNGPTYDSVLHRNFLSRKIEKCIRLLAPEFGGNEKATYCWTKGEKAPRIQVLEGLIKLL